MAQALLPRGLILRQTQPGLCVSQPWSAGLCGKQLQALHYAAAAIAVQRRFQLRCRARKRRQRPRQQPSGEEHITALQQYDFADVEYWDATYSVEGGTEPFDWMGNLEIFHKYIEHASFDAEILDLGCGTSRLAEQLHDIGYRHLTAVDISAVAVEAMRRRNAKLRPTIKWLQADALDLAALKDGSMDLIIDKSTMDAVACGHGCWNQNLVRIVASAFRVLREGGTYLVFSDSFIPKTAFRFPHVTFDVTVSTVSTDQTGKECQAQLSTGYVFEAVKSSASPLRSLDDVLVEAAEMDATLNEGSA
eukprot:TRINITY_DN27559_c0_g1_i1.p1 TRINITY_DN27559_c0_g1~~TRINITY_DN27559_c0_g1_i1.p1  ORF type:complete len:305 (+),score=53.63 TRINITY_DN27559_c0_g1_i1:2-916(+)